MAIFRHYIIQSIISQNGSEVSPICKHFWYKNFFHKGVWTYAGVFFSKIMKPASLTDAIETPPFGNLPNGPSPPLIFEKNYMAFFLGIFCRPKFAMNFFDWEDWLCLCICICVRHHGIPITQLCIKQMNGLWADLTDWEGCRLGSCCSALSALHSCTTSTVRTIVPLSIHWAWFPNTSLLPTPYIGLW